jgi:hypothetical protein
VPDFARNLDHPFAHRAIQGCGFCSLPDDERHVIQAAIPALVKVHENWLQYQPRTTSEAISKVFSSACLDSQGSWLFQALGDALWYAGYFPDEAFSPDPRWTWGMDL